MFIEVHGYKTGNVIYINADKITSLEPYKKGGATVIFGDTATFTQENHHEIMYRIEEAKKYANITL